LAKIIEYTNLINKTRRKNSELKEQAR